MMKRILWMITWLLCLTMAATAFAEDGKDHLPGAIIGATATPRSELGVQATATPLPTEVTHLPGVVISGKTAAPSEAPTAEPTPAPTNEPTEAPTEQPTAAPQGEGKEPEGKVSAPDSIPTAEPAVQAAQPNRFPVRVIIGIGIGAAAVIAAIVLLVRRRK